MEEGNTTLRFDWAASDHYNAKDLNRIEAHTRLLVDRLNSYGYMVDVQTKQQWEDLDIPTRGEIDRIRSNVDALQTAFYAMPDWRKILYNNTVDFKQTNALEWDLYILYIWLFRMLSAFRHSGTAHSGQGGLIV